VEAEEEAEVEAPAEEVGAPVEYDAVVPKIPEPENLEPIEEVD
jgi:hypothetical protein